MNQNPQAPASRKRVTAIAFVPTQATLDKPKVGGGTHAEVAIDNGPATVDESGGHYQAAPIPQHPVEQPIPPAKGAPASTKSWTPPPPQDMRPPAATTPQKPAR